VRVRVRDRPKAEKRGDTTCGRDQDLGGAKNERVAAGGKPRQKKVKGIKKNTEVSR